MQRHVQPETHHPKEKTKAVSIDTEYDRAKVPPYNGNDPPPTPRRLKALLFPPLLNKVQNKGTQGVQARYGAELPPFISIVQYPGRPVIFGMALELRDLRLVRGCVGTDTCGCSGFFRFPLSLTEGALCVSLERVRYTLVNCAERSSRASQRTRWFPTRTCRSAAAYKTQDQQI